MLNWQMGGGGGDGEEQAFRTLRLLALGRAAVGVLVLLAPRRLVRPALAGPGPSDEAVTVLRMFAGRDLALGLGAVLAGRRNPGSVRGWIEAGALADATDVLAFAGARTLKPAVRLGGLTSAAAATVLAALTAPRLPRA
jgi:hypothetical protein